MRNGPPDILCVCLSVNVGLRCLPLVQSPHKQEEEAECSIVCRSQTLIRTSPRYPSSNNKLCHEHRNMWQMAQPWKECENIFMIQSFVFNVAPCSLSFTLSHCYPLNASCVMLRNVTGELCQPALTIQGEERWSTDLFFQLKTPGRRGPPWRTLTHTRGMDLCSAETEPIRKTTHTLQVLAVALKLL